MTNEDYNQFFAKVGTLIQEYTNKLENIKKTLNPTLTPQQKREKKQIEGFMDNLRRYGEEERQKH